MKSNQSLNNTIFLLSQKDILELLKNDLSKRIRKSKTEQIIIYLSEEEQHTLRATHKKINSLKSTIVAGIRSFNNPLTDGDKGDYTDLLYTLLSEKHQSDGLGNQRFRLYAWDPKKQKVSDEDIVDTRLRIERNRKKIRLSIIEVSRKSQHFADNIFDILYSIVKNYDVQLILCHESKPKRAGDRLYVDKALENDLHVKYSGTSYYVEYGEIIIQEKPFEESDEEEYHFIPSERIYLDPELKDWMHPRIAGKLSEANKMHRLGTSNSELIKEYFLLSIDFLFSGVKKRYKIRVTFENSIFIRSISFCKFAT